METQTQIPKSKPTSPILIIAAIAVVIFSATGTAAILGWLPTSSAGTNENAAVATAPEEAAVNTAVELVVEPKPEPVPVHVAAAPVEPVCDTCGVVESIREIKKRGDGSGIGAVGGAVVGGLVGHQFGGGSGKKIATVAGAVGGAFAGHQIEKEVKATKSYEITVRLDNGSTEVVNTLTASSWQAGDKVKIINGQIQSI
jgi:outer membrane lipoprotein SlyB